MNKKTKMGLHPIEEYEQQFTRRWFKNRNMETFQEYVYPKYAYDPITYLEIGVFEGMSMTWMLQNVLTHPDARAVGVDPWLMMPKLDTEFMEGVRERALHNLSKWTATGKCQLFRSTSAEFLDSCLKRKGGVAGIVPNSVDLCMIDGNHWAPFVAYDAIRVYELMKPGGMILFDDVENDRKKENHVKEGQDMFFKHYNYQCCYIEWKHKYMEGYRVYKEGFEVGQ